MLNAANTLLKRLDGLVLRTTLGAVIVNDKGEPWVGGAGDPAAQGYKYYIPTEKDTVTQQRLNRFRNVVYYRGSQPNHNYRAHAKSSLVKILTEGSKREPETNQPILMDGDMIDPAKYTTLAPWPGNIAEHTESDDDSPDDPDETEETLEWQADEIIAIAQTIAQRRYGEANPTILRNIAEYVNYDPSIYQAYPRGKSSFYIHFRDPRSPDNCTAPSIQFTGEQVLALVCHINERGVECVMDRCEVIDNNALKVTIDVSTARAQQYVFRKTPRGFHVAPGRREPTVEALVAYLGSRLEAVRVDANGRVEQRRTDGGADEEDPW
jgi:hypothetical protein